MYIKSQFKPFKYTVSEHVTHLFFLFNNSTRDILKTSTCIWTNYQNYLITLNITFKTASEMLTFPNINSNYYYFFKRQLMIKSWFEPCVWRTWKQTPFREKLPPTWSSGSKNQTKCSQFVPVTEAAARSAALQKRARSDRQNKKLTNYF